MFDVLHELIDEKDIRIVINICCDKESVIRYEGGLSEMRSVK